MVMSSLTHATQHAPLPLLHQHRVIVSSATNPTVHTMTPTVAMSMMMTMNPITKLMVTMTTTNTCTMMIALSAAERAEEVVVGGATEVALGTWVPPANGLTTEQTCTRPSMFADRWPSAQDEDHTFRQSNRQFSNNNCAPEVLMY